jgi:para-aminobenzoate synthetase/4-amino-4-deoxychorismate lyase
VRLRLARDGELSVDLQPFPAAPEGPVRLVVDPEPVHSGDAALYTKTTLREPYERRFARRGDADDAILVNERGELTETTRATLALLLDGKWCTPALDCGCLPGVERARLLEVGRLRERVLTRTDLHRADGLAVISSLRGWLPATLAGARTLVGSASAPGTGPG